MGKSKGRPKRGKLADMAIRPRRAPIYLPPPREACVEETYPLVFTLEDELRCRWWTVNDTYKVDFAIVQVVRIDGEWHEVARIDCAHGTVHHHQLLRKRPGDTVGVRNVLELIPLQRGWETVDRWYGQALTLMENQWQQSKQKWGGDHE